MSNENTLEAVLVSAADLVEIRDFMEEIRRQNSTMLTEMRQNQKGWEQRHGDHDRRIGRLERQMKWMIVALIIAATAGFAAGWRWRGEVTQGPQIIYAPASTRP